LLFFFCLNSLFFLKKNIELNQPLQQNKTKQKHTKKRVKQEKYPLKRLLLKNVVTQASNIQKVEKKIAQRN